jgi:hypothetical protein
MNARELAGSPSTLNSRKRSGSRTLAEREAPRPNLSVRHRLRTIATAIYAVTTPVAGPLQLFVTAATASSPCERWSLMSRARRQPRASVGPDEHAIAPPTPRKTPH